MVYKRVRGWTLGRSLPVLNFLKYPPWVSSKNSSIQEFKVPYSALLVTKGYMCHLLNPKKTLYLRILQTLLCKARHTLEHTEKENVRQRTIWHNRNIIIIADYSNFSGSGGGSKRDFVNCLGFITNCTDFKFVLFIITVRGEVKHNFILTF